MVENPIFAHSTKRYKRVLYILDIVIAIFLHFLDCWLLKSFEDVIIRLARLKKWTALWSSKGSSWLIALSPICGTHISIVSFDRSPPSIFVARIFIIHDDLHIDNLRILLKVALNEWHCLWSKSLLILYERFKLHRAYKLSVLLWKNSVISFSLWIFRVIQKFCHKL